MNAISDSISRFIFFVGDRTGRFWENVALLDLSPWQIFLDIVLVALLFYWLILFLKGSRAMNILLGLFVLGAVFLVSRLFDLFAIGFLLDRVFTVVLVAIPVIFQQELRYALERLGRTKWFFSEQAKQTSRIVSEVVTACTQMAQKSVGALIVFQNKVSLKEYVETGIRIDGEISKELLLSIFNKQSPLHDGAVIISDGAILAAACVLPHSFKKYPHPFGTRHKAAIGISETTDSAIVLVSEERGQISFVMQGEIETDITSERLQERLRMLLLPRTRRQANKKHRNKA